MSTQQPIIIVWFRRDLHVRSNPVFTHALKSGLAVLPVYIHDADEAVEWQSGDASRWWLHHSLASLEKSLTSRGLKLQNFTGDAVKIISGLMSHTNVSAIVWSNLYEPSQIQQDDKIEQMLKTINVKRFDSHLLFTPGSILNKSSEPCRVFTPFWKMARQQLGSQGITLAQTTKKPVVYETDDLHSGACQLDDLKLLDSHPWHEKLRQNWQPGEQAAYRLSGTFFDQHIGRYDHDHDIAAVNGTSQLSLYLYFGEITPAQIVYQVQ